MPFDKMDTGTKVSNFIIRRMILKNESECAIIKAQRVGLKDVWNAFMLDGASYTRNDIPLCHTTAVAPPGDVITWEEAKAIMKS